MPDEVVSLDQAAINPAENIREKHDKFTTDTFAAIYYQRVVTR